MLDTFKKIHFIGIGGISMSGLAEIMYTRGYIVSGSDMNSSTTTAHLENLGIEIFQGHFPSNITSDIDIVVYTAAIQEDNPELIAARSLVKNVLVRSEFLGWFMKTYEFPICVSGTHGKTTTTSMLSEILINAKKNPTITVGGILNSINGNIYIGGSKYFLTEACEYCNSFLDFYPKVGIILNVEEDHMDFFKDLNDIYNSFNQFVKLFPPDGYLVIPNDGINKQLLLKDVKNLNIETVGLSEEANWYAADISYSETAGAAFKVFHNSALKGIISLKAPGKHNVLNALSACATATFLGIDFDIVANSLGEFTGANQRFEIKGNIHGVTIIDDYAHHPTEISATLNVANNYNHKDLYVIFQPHTYSRTKAFLNEFATSLSSAKNVIITDIYAAREKNPGDIHSKDIVSIMKNNGANVIYIDDFDEIANYILSNCSSGDMVITMGAGNVNQIADILLGK
ncbi:UDP-N-acetylmuramate--L-alanine ligase [Candidatus Epulonipiscium fishelsonii]|uniref:UDP-N-acetylmuramate--L-alanine ligase n=1 Tax=Candidatus Epulonipiscium fishelsonii TaxID=77094 RepID=A0ACC8X9L8_9FIRM|nr:UDP-N-acetylmuramate--L-alanine ligase [Epulopiscium sp. SCG-B05WGA-EpuloA1]ONI38797.1 UDP-N-acetylmuramate--L-alanine ligase [Epulopiscium sp. SCG-B11WGA-EpuloA1]